MSMVAADKDVIILRTFSKLYGMAGLRAGVGDRPAGSDQEDPRVRDQLEPGDQRWWAPMAALKAKNVIPERKKINADIRDTTIAFLEKKGFKVIPSLSNKFMVDTKKPTREAIAALRKENVFVGRPWPAMPTHIRVTVGTKEEMEKFQAAFVKVMV